MTAQGLWSFPVDLESMVPMVIEYARIENWLSGYSHVATFSGNSILRTSYTSHLKMQKKISDRNDAAVSIPNRNRMFWGYGQAVLVIVENGKPGT